MNKLAKQESSIDLPDEFAGAMSTVNLEQMFRFAKESPRDPEAAIEKTVRFFLAKESRAEKAYYTLPRDGKSISGPSIRLAEVLFSNVQNLHISTITRPIAAADKSVTTVSMVIDLEGRSVVVEEVSVSIVKRDGRRYPEHMIQTATAACRSKSYRNAVFRSVGKIVAEEVQEEIRSGTVRSIKEDKEVTIAQRFERAAGFVSKKTEGRFGAKDLMLLLGKSSIDEINAEDISTINGFRTAVLDGDATWNELFNGPAKTESSSSQEMGLGSKSELCGFIEDVVE